MRFNTLNQGEKDQMQLNGVIVVIYTYIYTQE